MLLTRYTSTITFELCGEPTIEKECPSIIVTRNQILQAKGIPSSIHDHMKAKQLHYSIISSFSWVCLNDECGRIEEFDGRSIGLAEHEVVLYYTSAFALYVPVSTWKVQSTYPYSHLNL